MSDDFNVGEFRCHVAHVEGFPLFLAWGCRVAIGEPVPGADVPVYLETFVQYADTEEAAVDELRGVLKKRMH